MNEEITEIPSGMLPYWERDSLEEKLVAIHVYGCMSTLVECIQKSENEQFEDDRETIMRAHYNPNFNEECDSEEFEYFELFEFWHVSPTLHSKLERAGEVVFEISGLPVWGRQTTGQAIKIDEVIKQIARDWKY